MGERERPGENIPTQRVLDKLDVRPHDVTSTEGSHSECELKTATSLPAESNEGSAGKLGTSETSGADRVKVLLELYREEWTQRRHYRDLRSRMAGTLLTIVGIVVALMTMDKSLDRSDRLAGLLLLAVGAFGIVFSMIKHDRYDLHRFLAQKLLEEVDRELKSSISGLISGGEATFKEANPRSEWLKVDRMYYILYSGIALVGALVAGFAR